MQGWKETVQLKHKRNVNIDQWNQNLWKWDPGIRIFKAVIAIVKVKSKFSITALGSVRQCNKWISKLLPFGQPFNTPEDTNKVIMNKTSFDEKMWNKNLFPVL